MPPGFNPAQMPAGGGGFPAGVLPADMGAVQQPQGAQQDESGRSKLRTSKL
jgi:hypothetical protein